MIQTIVAINSKIRIVLSEICSTGGINVDPYNSAIKEIAEALELKVVKQTDSLMSKGGDIVSSYFHRDGIHLNNQRTTQLLRNINKVTDMFAVKTQTSPRNRQLNHSNKMSKMFNGYCYFCGLYCHHCKDCEHSY